AGDAARSRSGNLFEARLSADLDLDRSRRRRRRLGSCRRSHRSKLGACSAAPLAGGWGTMNESESERRRRWITLGELIALAALIVSGLGVWISWKSSSNDKTTKVVEQHQPVPLILRGIPDSDGSTMIIAPVNRDH